MPALPLPAGTDHDIPLALDVDGASQLASTIAGMHCHSSGWQFYPGLQISSTTGTTPVKAHARLQPWGQPRSSSVRIPLWNPRDRAQKRLTKIQTCRSSPAIFSRSLTYAIALQILWILRNEHPRFGLKRPRRATKNRAYWRAIEHQVFTHASQAAGFNPCRSLKFRSTAHLRQARGKAMKPGTWPGFLRNTKRGLARYK